MERPVRMRFPLALRRMAGWHTLVALALLWLSCASAAWQLSELIRGFDLGLILQFITLALLLGWWLARASRSVVRAPLAGAAVVAGVVFVRVGQLGDKLA